MRDFPKPKEGPREVRASVVTCGAPMATCCIDCPGVQRKLRREPGDCLDDRSVHKKVGSRDEARIVSGDGEGDVIESASRLNR